MYPNIHRHGVEAPLAPKYAPRYKTSPPTPVAFTYASYRRANCSVSDSGDDDEEDKAKAPSDFYPLSPKQRKRKAGAMDEKEELESIQAQPPKRQNRARPRHRPRKLVRSTPNPAGPSGIRQGQKQRSAKRSHPRGSAFEEVTRPFPTPPLQTPNPRSPVGGWNPHSQEHIGVWIRENKEQIQNSHSSMQQTPVFDT